MLFGYPPPASRVEDSGLTGTNSVVPIGSTLELIASRSSTKKFSDLAVSATQVDALLTAAVRAPDHGQLGPWRFTILEGSSRELLGRAMAGALKEKSPEADDEAVSREFSKALRSPVLIVVSAVTRDHPKVPQVEQWVAVGAAIQNLWIAAESMGLGVAWKTGSHAYNTNVKAALGLSAEESIIGFIHVGHPISKAPVRPADLNGKVRRL